MIRGIYASPNVYGAWYDPMPSTTYQDNGASTPSYNGGGSVAYLKDTSGFNDNAKQINHANAPTLGQNSLLLNGSNQFMSSPSGGGSAVGNGSGGFFFCQAFNMTTGNNTNRTLFSDKSTNGGYQVRINSSNQAEITYGTPSGFGAFAASEIISLNITYVVMVWGDGKTINIQVNNDGVATSTATTIYPGTTQFTIGADNNSASGYFGGTLWSSVYMANTGLVNNQRQRIKNYCMSKAGVITKPAGIPGKIGSTFVIGQSALGETVLPAKVPGKIGSTFTIGQSALS